MQTCSFGAILPVRDIRTISQHHFGSALLLSQFAVTDLFFLFWYYKCLHLDNWRTLAKIVLAKCITTFIAFALITAL